MAADPYHILRAIAQKEESPGTLTFLKGSYLLSAASDDGLVHFIILTAEDNFRLHYQCGGRPFIDDRETMLSLLRDRDEPVTCMTCAARGPCIRMI